MAPAWIELQGTANTRDLGGLPGIAAGVVIRSDNLQDLTPADVETLTVRHHVTQVIDLRTPGEAEAEGPTPLQAAGVDYALLSYVPDLRDPAAGPDERILPDRAGQDRTSVYLGYLQDCPDAVVESVRRVAHARGATVIHCAAGKDRTGTLAALLLDVAGVPRADIVADYAATAEVIDAVMARLAVRPVYAADLADVPSVRHVPQAGTMEEFLEHLHDAWGGAGGWLTAHGLSADDLALVRARLTAQPGPASAPASASGVDYLAGES